jgi:hypothetical protein
VRDAKEVRVFGLRDFVADGSGVSTTMQYGPVRKDCVTCTGAH